MQPLTPDAGKTTSSLTYPSPRPFTVAQRPRRYGAGTDLPCGTYSIEEVSDGVWTVVRRNASGTWYPLTARRDPNWLLWPSETGARVFASGYKTGTNPYVDGFDCADWPHWGAQ